jgi:Bacterial PH domain
MSDSDPNKEILPEGELLRLNEWGEALGWLLAGFAFLLGLFLLVVSPLKHGQLDGPLRPVLGLVWMAFGAMIGWNMRRGLIVDQAGIIVQRSFRRRRWTWPEIERFELKQPFVRPVLRIRFTDGTQTSTFGFNSKSRQERLLADARVAELNRRALG